MRTKAPKSDISPDLVNPIDPEPAFPRLGELAIAVEALVEVRPADAERMRGLEDFKAKRGKFNG